MVDPAQTAASVGPFARLGLDWRLLIAQLVNFGLVLFVVWKWIYRPLLRVMDARVKRIEKGLEDAEAAAEDRRGADEEKQRVLGEARHEAKRIVAEAEQRAKDLQETQKAKAAAEVENILRDGRQQLHADKEAMLTEARSDLAGLVLAATEKVVDEKLDAKRDAALIKRAISGKG